MNTDDTPRPGAHPQAPTTRGNSPSEGGTEPSWVAPTLLLGTAVFLYLVRGILPPFVIAAVLAYVFGPVVGSFETRARVPRPLAIALSYLLVLGPLSIFLWVFEPTLVSESQALAYAAPNILRGTLVQVLGGERVEVLGVTIDADSMVQYALDALRSVVRTPTEAIHVAAGIVEALVGAFLSLVLTFYFLLYPGWFTRAVLRFAPTEQRGHWQRAASEIHLMLGRYIRGLLLLVLLVAAATWLGLSLIFHLPHALPIAVATGFLEIIPFVGPVLAGAIAAMAGLFYGGPNMAVGVVAFYFVLRQVEDQMVMPMVIGRAVELHPAVAIFAVLAGGVLGGILGALLGIPVAVAIKAVIHLWRPE